MVVEIIKIIFCGKNSVPLYNKPELNLESNDIYLFFSLSNEKIVKKNVRYLQTTKAEFSKIPAWVFVS